MHVFVVAADVASVTAAFSDVAVASSITAVLPVALLLRVAKVCPAEFSKEDA